MQINRTEILILCIRSGCILADICGAVDRELAILLALSVVSVALDAVDHGIILGCLEKSFGGDVQAVILILHSLTGLIWPCTGFRLRASTSDIRGDLLLFLSAVDQCLVPSS